jgi:hypothetical protein
MSARCASEPAPRSSPALAASTSMPEQASSQPLLGGCISYLMLYCTVGSCLAFLKSASKPRSMSSAFVRSVAGLSPAPGGGRVSMQRCSQASRFLPISASKSLPFAAAHQRTCPLKCRVGGVQALFGYVRLFQFGPRLLQPDSSSGQRGVMALDLGRFLVQRHFASLAMAIQLLNCFKRHRLLFRRRLGAGRFRRSMKRRRRSLQSLGAGRLEARQQPIHDRLPCGRRRTIARKPKRIPLRRFRQVVHALRRAEALLDEVLGLSWRRRRGGVVAARGLAGVGSLGVLCHTAGQANAEFDRWPPGQRTSGPRGAAAQSTQGACCRADGRRIRRLLRRCRRTQSPDAATIFATNHGIDLNRPKPCRLRQWPSGFVTVGRRVRIPRHRVVLPNHGHPAASCPLRLQLPGAAAACAPRPVRHPARRSVAGLSACSAPTSMLRGWNRCRRRFGGAA